MASVITYVEAALARGLHIDQIAPSLRLHLNSDNDIFEEAAKFRAARRLWASTISERFGAKKSESMMLSRRFSRPKS